jgi:hypothetical protein
MRPWIVTLALLTACEPEPVVVDDITWVPALTDETSGVVDFGEVPQAETAHASITATNNTDADMIFTVDCGGVMPDFLATCPAGEQTVAADPDGPTTEDGEGAESGGSVSASLNFAAAGAADYEGSVQFVYDSHVVTYIVRATRLP